MEDKVCGPFDVVLGHGVLAGCRLAVGRLWGGIWVLVAILSPDVQFVRLSCCVIWKDARYTRGDAQERRGMVITGQTRGRLGVGA